MIIRNLIEDTDGGNGCRFEHGLSFYIETPSHRLLMDTGASPAFLDNAKKLGVDLRLVDTVILSHGHYDHGGGLLAFAELNPRAKIYLRRNAMGDYCRVRDGRAEFIGLHPDIAALAQVVFVDGDITIDEELSLFTNVTARKLWPDGNRLLKSRKDGELVQDDFSHEQYLILTCEGKRILLSGCAHNGIVNILERFRELCGRDPDAVISGFHTMRRMGQAGADRKLLEEIAGELGKYRDTIFYTGHCTGEDVYDILRHYLGGQICYVRSGEEICIP